MALDPGITGYPSSPTGSLDRSKPLRTGLSTQVLISVDGESIGAVQRFSPVEDRPLQRIQEVGTDAVVEITPMSPTTVTVTASRLVFDRQTIIESLGSRGFRHIHAQTKPFDIVIYNYNIQDLNQTGFEEADLTGGNPLVTTYWNCWLQHYETTYEQTNYIITENVTIWPESVSDNYSDETQGTDVERILNTSKAASGATWIPIMRSAGNGVGILPNQ